jgi:hemolysin activation/secretion protein
MVLKKLISIIAASTILLCSSLTIAATAPGPPPPNEGGQSLHDLQQQLGLTKPKPATPPPRLEGESTPPSATVTSSDNARVAVKAIHVMGITVFSAAELEAVVNYLVGGEHTLDELNAGAARITNFYHERGYVVTRAYLPPQEIRNGEVVINVMEGHIGKQIINNQSRLSDQHVSDFLSDIKSGDVLQSAPVDRQLFLLNEMPGVGVARAVLQPGASVGTADVVFDLTSSARYVANIELDNYGNYYTGEYRLGAELVINSPLKRGDQLTLRALGSNQNLAYEYIAYQVPVGGSGLRLGAAYFETSYRLHSDTDILLQQTYGTADSISMFGVYPFVRTPVKNLSGTLVLENKKLLDTLVYTRDKRVQSVSFGLNGRYQDTLGQAGITSFDLSLVIGRLRMDGDSLTFDIPRDYGPDTNGLFSRMSYNVNRLQRLTETDSLSAALSGQLASKNLNSSEKYSLGGVNAVRAYPQGEASGDQGWMTNLEVRHNFDSMLQGVMFYDAGSVKINKFQYTAGDNTRHIAGAGVGANANLAGGQIKASLAWRTSSSLPNSEPPTLKRNPRLWLQAGWQF